WTSTGRAGRVARSGVQRLACRRVAPEISEVALWSTHVLAKAWPDVLLAFCEGLSSNDQITLAGQITLDTRLTELRRSEWTTLAQRHQHPQGLGHIRRRAEMTMPPTPGATRLTARLECSCCLRDSGRRLAPDLQGLRGLPP